MAKVDVRLDRSAMSEFLKSDQVRAPLHEIAESSASRARGSAPVASGEYRDRITVESDTTDRAVERVVAHAPHSSVVEAKTGNLKRALGG